MHAYSELCGRFVSHDCGLCENIRVYIHYDVAVLNDKCYAEQNIFEKFPKEPNERLNNVNLLYFNGTSNLKTFQAVLHGHNGFVNVSKF